MPHARDTAFRAALEAAALVDLSRWGRLRVGGQDRLRFLHNYTTAAFQNAQHGEAIEAVVLTATARMIDYVTALVEEEHVWLLTSPERRAVLPNWFQRFIFFNDDVTVEDATEQTGLLSLIGPRSADVLAEAGVPLPEPGQFVPAALGEQPVLVVAGSGLHAPGYRLVALAPDTGPVRERLLEVSAPLGLVEADGETWEQLRVWHGRPAADREITEEYNPLEAGLWHAIRFDKGCYIGQEVVARLDTYRKIKQHLMRVDLEAPAPAGSEVTADGKTVGRLTSVAETPVGTFGLAYIRREAAQPGREVTVLAGAEVVNARLSDPLFVRRERPPELP